MRYFLLSYYGEQNLNRAARICYLRQITLDLLQASSTLLRLSPVIHLLHSASKCFTFDEVVGSLQNSDKKWDIIGAEMSKMTIERGKKTKSRRGWGVKAAVVEGQE